MYLLLLIIVCFLTLIALGTMAALFLALIGAFMTGVPYLRATGGTKAALIERMPLKAGDIFYELGCGDGWLVAALAKRYPEARVVGIERAPLPALFAWIRMRLPHPKNMSIVYGDIAREPLTQATHLFSYLMPAVMEKLLPKLERELAHGVHLLSLDFPFKHKKEVATVPLTGSHRLYVYEF